MKIFCRMNDSLIKIVHDFYPLYCFIRENDVDLFCDKRPVWTEDFKISDYEGCDIYVAMRVDSVVIADLKKKKHKVSVFFDAKDMFDISAVAVNNFDIVFKHQVRKGTRCGNVFVPPYPISNGNIPDRYDNFNILPWSQRDIDVSFIGGYINKNDKNNIRARIVRELKKNFDNFYGGITSEGSDVYFKAIPWASYMEVLSRSKVSISISQNEKQKRLDRRMGEIMCTGTCVITHPLNAVVGFDLVDRENIVFTDDNMTNIVDLVRECLDDGESTQKIAQNGKCDFIRKYRDQGNWFFNILKGYL